MPEVQARREGHGVGRAGHGVGGALRPHEGVGLGHRHAALERAEERHLEGFSSFRAFGVVCCTSTSRPEPCERESGAPARGRRRSAPGPASRSRGAAAPPRRRAWPGAPGPRREPRTRAPRAPRPSRRTAPPLPAPGRPSRPAAPAAPAPLAPLVASPVSVAAVPVFCCRPGYRGRRPVRGDARARVHREARVTHDVQRRGEAQYR